MVATRWMGAEVSRDHRGIAQLVLSQVCELAMGKRATDGDPLCKWRYVARLNGLHWLAVPNAPSCPKTYFILGHSGKVFFRMIRIFLLCVLMLTVAGCRNEAADRLQSGQVMNIFGLEGRWVGPVTPNAEGCGKTSTGLMSVERKTFAFDPFEGTTVINGTVSDAGKLEGRLSRPSGGQQVVTISFLGAAGTHAGAGETIDGQMQSGRCSWAVILKRG